MHESSSPLLAARTPRTNIASLQSGSTHALAAIGSGAARRLTLVRGAPGLLTRYPSRCWYENGLTEA